MSLDYQWSLKELYESFDSNALKNDLENLRSQVRSFSKFAEESYYPEHSEVAIIEEYIHSENTLGALISRLAAFGNLSQSTEAKNEAAEKLLDQVRAQASKLTGPRVTFVYWLKDQASKFESLCANSLLIEAHRFVLLERIQESRHLLSREEESLISDMVRTGSSAWENLQNKMTSLTLIPITLQGETKSLPLSAIRNLAFHEDPVVRKTAFEAELGAYPLFEDVSAAALSAIKGEVITLADKKGYESPLQMSLEHSRMDKAVLDALLSAMKESLPTFRRYLKGKAKALGHKGALPFYDLFAPLGSSKTVLDIETCQSIVIEAFDGFSDELGNFARQAFSQNWVDFKPRAGKRGGAFCSNIYGIGQSRFLCNYQGSLNNIITVAHELGHGFHGHNVFKESYINSGYPMPLAETASTFCETIIKHKLLANADKDEKLLLLETALQGYNQIIVDIYSRFLFESAVFEERKEGSLSPLRLCQLMTEAQKEAYGDSLDLDTLHPYMWMNKVHYYYASRNFYNFPYAFGLLFAMGLYAQYEQEGEPFTERYNQMLRLTGKASIKDVGAFMGIDLTDQNFWKGSLALMSREIDSFLELID